LNSYAQQIHHPVLCSGKRFVLSVQGRTPVVLSNVSKRWCSEKRNFSAI